MPPNDKVVRFQEGFSCALWRRSRVAVTMAPNLHVAAPMPPVCARSRGALANIVLADGSADSQPCVGHAHAAVGRRVRMNAMWEELYRQPSRDRPLG